MARPKKKRPDEPLGNLTAETFREHVDNIKEAVAAKDSAVAKLRNVRKQAQEAGVSTRILDKALAIEKQDRYSQRADYNDLARYLQWLGTPIGQQLDLLPETPADFQEDQPQEAVH